MTAENTPLDFHELQRELQEFGGRVIVVELRLGSGELLATLEGEYGGVDSEPDDPDDVWFQVGGIEPPSREGLEFIVAASGAIRIPAHRFVNARRESGGIGAFVITIETKSVELDVGVEIRVWPAMPPRKQWTPMHNDDR